MTRAIRTTSTVDANGNLHLPPMPLAVGKTVDVIILVDDGSTPFADREKAKQLLRDSVARFDDPFGPAVPPDDWRASE